MDDDVFKNHVATYEKHNDHLETLRWRNPKCSQYAIWYVRQYGVLMVFGDCYEATYMWSWDGKVTLEWIATLDLGYFLSKCRASPHGREAKFFSSHELEENLKEYFAESCTRNQPQCPEGECEDCDRRRKEEKLFGETGGALHGGWDCTGDEFEWVEWLREYGDDVFGQDWWESVPSGKMLDPCIKLHLEGLKRAMAQLKEKENAKIQSGVASAGDLLRDREGANKGGGGSLGG